MFSEQLKLSFQNITLKFVADLGDMIAKLSDQNAVLYNTTVTSKRKKKGGGGGQFENYMHVMLFV